MELRPTLRQLRFLCEVARWGSFTRAAEALYVSQPSVSSALQDLERQAGLPLFERTGRRVQLAPAGRILCEYAGRILAGLSEAERALEGLRQGDAGRLVVGASSTPGTYLLPELLAAFRAAHPRVELVLEIADTREVLQRVLEGRLDLGVVGETDFGPRGRPALRVELFRRETLVLILPPRHPLAARPRLRLADLAGEPFVLREPGSSTREVLQRALRARGFEPRVLMELGSTEAVKRAVAAGLGISLVSEHSVALEERAGALVARRVPDLDPGRGLYLIRRAALSPTPLHERFVAALRPDPAHPSPAAVPAPTPPAPGTPCPPARRRSPARRS